jgi:hypothetical protein
VTTIDDFHLDEERRRDLLVGQALGILDGRDRAAVLAHVAACEGCARELAAFVSAADDVLASVPDAEPSVGFESSVLARIETESRGSRGARRTGVMVSLAAVVVALALGVGVLIGALSTPPEPRATGAARMVEAPLFKGHHEVGAVYASSGSPGWLVVTVAATDPPAMVDCQLLTSHSTQWLGTFTLGPPVASWTVPLPVPLASVRGVILTYSNGVVVATTHAFTRTSTYGV